MGYFVLGVIFLCILTHFVLMGIFKLVNRFHPLPETDVIYHSLRPYGCPDIGPKESVDMETDLEEGVGEREVGVGEREVDVQQDMPV
ncbi:hypothetical protein KIPB_012980 [Kipferlia bialata]|uniref:Uncharacterized protein n=1 Tax=Kipferlia bialata TaxID=797122 RepID=A0A9K3GP63_9EUKA|nr:hypothetical protein KIPB_012980 [Kipferlia bialata]|eukprot:g12980.t1